MYPSSLATKLIRAVEDGREVVGRSIAPDSPGGCAVTAIEERAIFARLDYLASVAEEINGRDKEIVHLFRTGRHSRDFLRQAQ